MAACRNREQSRAAKQATVQRMILTPENAGKQLANKIAGKHQQPACDQKEHTLCPVQHLKHRIHPQVSIVCNPKHPTSIQKQASHTKICSFFHDPKTPLYTYPVSTIGSQRGLIGQWYLCMLSLQCFISKMLASGKYLHWKHVWEWLSPSKLTVGGCLTFQKLYDRQKDWLVCRQQTWLEINFTEQWNVTRVVQFRTGEVSCLHNHFKCVKAIAHLRSCCTGRFWSTSTFTGTNSEELAIWTELHTSRLQCKRGFSGHMYSQ